MTLELLELSIDGEPGFLEYERHLRRVLVQAFAVPVCAYSFDPIEIGFLSPLYQRLPITIELRELLADET